MEDGRETGDFRPEVTPLYNPYPSVLSPTRLDDIVHYSMPFRSCDPSIVAFSLSLSLILPGRCSTPCRESSTLCGVRVQDYQDLRLDLHIDFPPRDSFIYGSKRRTICLNFVQGDSRSCPYHLGSHVQYEIFQGKKKIIKKKKKNLGKEIFFTHVAFVTENIF